MAKLIVGILIGLVLIPAGAAAYFMLGLAPVATSAPPMPLERQLAGIALHARIGKEAPTKEPFLADEAAMTEGIHLYRQHCAMCHGLPGQPKTAIAKGMFPEPPQLLEGTGVTDDPAGETYWKVKNGIRLTGMPGYSASLSDTQMWQVSLLLAHADKMPQSVKQIASEPLAVK